MFAAQIDQLVYDFNCRPLQYVDPSWVGAAYRSAVEELKRSRDSLACSIASKWLLEELELTDKFDFAFEDPVKRILLLEPRVLKDLVLFLGLSGAHNVISRWVKREDREVLKRAVGQDAYAFYRGEVIRWPVFARLPISEARLRGVPENLLLRTFMHFGTRILLSSCESSQSPSYVRASVKLPKTLVPHRRYPSMPRERALKVADFSICCVIRLREPSWHWLF